MQYAIFRLLQKWQTELDSGDYIGTIFMDSSKAYDCLSHDLLTAKLEAYGLDLGSLNFPLDYLSLKKCRTEVGSSYSKWSEICRGIPQGSILGSLLFTIFINDILFFVEKSEICNFTDDNTIYSCGKDLRKIKEDLICTMKNILKWFMLNSLKAYSRKFQFMILSDKTCYKHILKINLTCVQSSDEVTLLGEMTDKNLTFKKDIDNLVHKAHYKLHALRCIRKFLTIEKAKVLGNAFIDCQFSYAPLTWMFCRKTFYSKIQKIHQDFKSDLWCR